LAGRCGLREAAGAEVACGVAAVRVVRRPLGLHDRRGTDAEGSDGYTRVEALGLVHLAYRVSARLLGCAGVQDRVGPEEDAIVHWFRSAVFVQHQRLARDWKRPGGMSATTSCAERAELRRSSAIRATSTALFIGLPTKRRNPQPRWR